MQCPPPAVLEHTIKQDLNRQCVSSNRAFLCLFGYIEPMQTDSIKQLSDQAKQNLIISLQFSYLIPSSNVVTLLTNNELQSRGNPKVH